MLDTFAAMVSGADLPPGHIALNFARRYRGQKTATVVRTGVLCGPLEAALANGILAHSDERDDSHSPSHSHPGCAVVPAALAVAELFEVDGQHLRRAVALGYDIGPRVLMALGGLSFQMKSHRSSHSIANTFGASATVGCCAGLSGQQIRWLLDCAAQQASGVTAWQQDSEHIELVLVLEGRQDTRSEERTSEDSICNCVFDGFAERALCGACGMARSFQAASSGFSSSGTNRVPGGTDG